MYERFTDRARKAMRVANQEAQRMGHQRIDTEHVLLGLIREGAGRAGPSLAVTLLGGSQDLRKLRLEVEKHTPPGDASAFSGKLPQTRLVKAVIEHASAEARRLQQNHVDCEHLLLGLLHEREGLAARMLERLGFHLDTVRQRLVELTSEPSEAVASQPVVPGTGEPRVQGANPQAVDDDIRRAISTCWHMLPPDRRSVEKVSNRIRQLTERALKDFGDDARWLESDSPK